MSNDRMQGPAVTVFHDDEPTPPENASEALAGSAAVSSAVTAVGAAAMKALAALKLVGLLGRGCELPQDLITEAMAEDLDAARLDCERIASARWREGTFSGGADFELRRVWEAASPRDRVRLFGAPALRSAITDRRKAEARAAWDRRKAAGFDPEIRITAPQIDRMITRGVFSANGDREDAAAVGAAAMTAIGFPGIPVYALPCPSGSPSSAADDVDRREAAAALFCEALGIEALPPEVAERATASDFDRVREQVIALTSATDLRAQLAIPMIEVAIRDRQEREAAAANAARLAAGVAFRPHLAGEHISKLRQALDPVPDAEFEQRLAAAVLERLQAALTDRNVMRPHRVQPLTFGDYLKTVGVPLARNVPSRELGDPLPLGSIDR